jgi:hypothetical protein
MATSDSKTRVNFGLADLQLRQDLQSHVTVDKLLR